MKPIRFPFLFALFLASVGASPDSAQAPDFSAACADDPKLCADAAALAVKVDSLAAEKPGPGNREIFTLNGDLIQIEHGIDAVAVERAGKTCELPRLSDCSDRNRRELYAPLKSLREKVRALSIAELPKELAVLSAEFLEQEERVDRLILEVKAAEQAGPQREEFLAKLQSINEDATKLWERVREASFNVDRIGEPIKSTKDKELTPAGNLTQKVVNPLQERLAALRDRLKAIQNALSPEPSEKERITRVDPRGVQDRLKNKGLDQDVFERRTAQDTPPAGPFTSEGSPASDSPARVNLTVTPATLLDSRAPPSITKPALEGSFPLNTGLIEIEDGRKIDENGTPAENTRIALLKKLRLTKTVGDPQGRAKYVFLQTGGTCALASQAQMYAEAHGIEPTPETMKALEDEFFARASKTRQFTGNSASPMQQRGTAIVGGGGGTTDEYLGNFLDTPVKKHYLATPEALFQAVKNGKMVMVTVNAGKLWNDETYIAGGNAIVITGAEVNKMTGGLLGYFINDTGRNKGGRFVSAKQFLSAWQMRGSVFVEPL